jgi:predicted ATPase
MRASLHVITGAPGSGKTAILTGMGGHVRCFGEAARVVLAHQRAIDGDGTPDRNPLLFVDLLLKTTIDDHQEARRRGGPALFDRGIPDCVAYARLLGTDPEPSIRAAQAHRYNPDVLVTGPWEEIYSTDDERTMTFGATIEFQRLIETAYEEAGYTLVEVPRGSVEARVAFVRRVIDGTRPGAMVPRPWRRAT